MIDTQSFMWFAACIVQYTFPNSSWHPSISTCCCRHLLNYSWRFDRLDMLPGKQAAGTIRSTFLLDFSVSLSRSHCLYLCLSVIFFWCAKVLNISHCHKMRGNCAGSDPWPPHTKKGSQQLRRLFCRIFSLLFSVSVFSGFFLAFSHMVFCYSPICWHRMSLSNARQRCLAIKDDMPHRMLLDINARLYHALGLGYNNATGICRNLYFTCERKEKKKEREWERE